MSDPNWFYSTLAQSTAAIVGLVGAFLIQRILAVRAEVAEERERIRSKAAEHLEKLVKARKDAEGTLEGLQGWREQIQEKVNSGERVFVITFNAGGLPDGLSSGRPKSISSGMTGTRFEHAHGAELLGFIDRSITVIRALVSTLPNSMDAYAEKVRGLSQEDLEGSVKATSEERTAAGNWTGPVVDSAWEGIQAQPALAERIEKRYFTFLAEDANKLRVLKSRISIGSFVTLLVILAALLAAGVIWPMTFLQDRATSPKAELLIPFSFLSGALLLYYALEVRRLSRALDLSRLHF